LGAAVLIVHHSGHGTAQRSRGSSSIRAAMDGEFSATKDGLSIVLSCTKAKDFEAFKPQQFGLMSIDLPWLDDDGEPLKSVYLEHTGDAKPTTKKQRLSARDDAILTTLSEAIDKHGVEPSAEIKSKFGGLSERSYKSRKVVHVDRWREKALSVIDAESPGAKQKAFTRARAKLFEFSKVANYDDFWWPIHE
jgi:hypothetical protein